MRLSRVVSYGGSIGGLAAWAFLGTAGLASAIGLVIASFALLVTVGLVIAILTEDVGTRSFSGVAARMRRVRHRRSHSDVCGVCGRMLIATTPVRVCAACDLIPAAIAH